MSDDFYDTTLSTTIVHTIIFLRTSILLPFLLVTGGGYAQQTFSNDPPRLLQSETQAWGAAREQAAQKYPSTGHPPSEFSQPSSIALRGLEPEEIRAPANQTPATPDEPQLVQPLAWETPTGGGPAPLPNSLRGGTEPRTTAVPETTAQPNPATPISNGLQPPTGGVTLPEQVTTLAAESTAEVPSVEEIVERIKQVEAAEGLDETVKSKQLEYLNKALEWREVAQQADARSKQLRAEAEQAPQAVATAKARLAESLSEPPPPR